jgi:hypothetical protein
VLGTHHSVQMVREDVSEAGAHDHHVVLVEVGRGGLALAAETQRVGIPGEELPSCYLTHREHQSINIIAPSSIFNKSTQTDDSKAIAKRIKCGIG